MAESDPDFDVQTLRVVRAIADTGSLTGAADALGYSQPALSQQMRRLEQRLGVPVVERVGRTLRLTEAGRILARHAPAVTTALDAAAGELAELRGLRSATVRVVGFPSASPTVIPRMIARLGVVAPGITLTYVEAEPPEAVEAVREDRSDIALTFSYPGDRDDPHGASARGLSVTDVGSDDLLLVLPADHARAGEERASLSSFADENWIAGCPRCRGHLLQVCERAGFTPRIGFETDNIAAVESLVAHGTGVATLPKLAVASFPVLPGIITRPLSDAHTRTLHAITAHGAERVPAVAAVLAAMRDVVDAVTGTGQAVGGGVAAN
ncbi:LysR family transcriptional regulator [uncultured Microbacterium sp.]|uniref:LysR family transcriptional regulator n=1 Tax=uncultured Microbacterium sp. TaxID=191216 RepID=UPI002634641B|nr:LysR family transcriptional regulator [uncultured Microbacterium sp.]